MSVFIDNENLRTRWYPVAESIDVDQYEALEEKISQDRQSLAGLQNLLEAVESLGAAEIEAELRALITAALPAALDLPPCQVPNGHLPPGKLPTGREADDSDPEVERLE